MVSVKKLKCPHPIHFPVGSEVEVSSDEEGFQGAWFAAKVLPSPPKAPKNRLFVEYKTLVSDENETEPLRELADLNFVRPLPPPPLESEKDAPFKLRDAVDAYYREGWWSGVVTEVLGERSYKVSFDYPPDEIVFDRSVLRIHRDWVDGRWILPKKQKMSQLSLNPGTAVEVNLEVENSIDIWYPGTVIKEIDGGSFLVNYDSPDKTGSREVVVSAYQIRSPPPLCSNKSFQLLDKVDAFCNSGWSSGVVTKVLSEGRYIVFFRRTRKEKELSYTDLRLPVLWADGKWVYASQDESTTSNSQETTRVHFHSDNDQPSVQFDNTASVKEIMKRSGKGGDDQAEPHEISQIDVVNTSTAKKIKLPTESNGSAQVCELMITPVERSSPKSEPNPEASNLGVMRTDCLEASENTHHTNADSESHKSELDVDNKLVELPSNQKTPAKRRGRPKGRLQGTRGTSSAKTQTRSAVNEGSSDPTKNSVVISLPCNSPRNSSHTGSPCKLLENKETSMVLAEETDHLKNSGEHGEIIGLEIKPMKEEVVTPARRKRGRPCGSTNKTGPAKKLIREKTKLTANNSRLGGNMRRPVKSFGKSAYGAVVMDSGARTYVAGKGRRVRSTMDVLSSACAMAELQSPKGQKAEVASTSGATNDADTRQDEILDSVSDDDRPLSTWYRETQSPPTTEYTKSSPVGNASRNHKAVESTSQVPEIAQHVKDTISTECDAENVDQCSREEDLQTEALPFLKSSVVWKMIESMPVFKQLPQKPHFHPLYDCMEHCREGIAIGSMITFTSLVEKIPSYQIGDPRNILEGSLETLLELERHGFSVEPIRGRLNSLLEIKNKHEAAWNESKEIQIQMAERHKEKANIDEELAEIDQKIAELREKRALAMLEKERKESEIVALKSNVGGIDERNECARAEFRKVATSPW